MKQLFIAASVLCLLLVGVASSEVMPGTSTQVPVSVYDQRTLTETFISVPMPTANTEYTKTLPTGTIRFLMKCVASDGVTGTAWKYTTIANGTTNGQYIPVAGTQDIHSMDVVGYNYSGFTVRFAATVANAIMKINCTIKP